MYNKLRVHLLCTLGYVKSMGPFCVVRNLRNVNYLCNIPKIPKTNGFEHVLDYGPLASIL